MPNLPHPMTLAIPLGATLTETLDNFVKTYAQHAGFGVDELRAIVLLNLQVQHMAQSLPTAELRQLAEDVSETVGESVMWGEYLPMTEAAGDSILATVNGN